MKNSELPTPRPWPVKTVALACVTALLSSGTAVHAQAAAAPDRSDAKNEILTLEQFTVSSTAASGYRATNSISATGIGVPIGDTPTMINVVTKDLIDDARVDRIADAVRFAPGVIAKENNESGPSIRGFGGGVLRNGVFRRQNFNTWNVDNVEVIQGATSIFYSNIRPGGIVNYNTIKPVFRNRSGTAAVSAGNHDYFRTEVGLNAGADNLAVRVDGGYLNANNHRQGQNIGEKFFSLAGSWKITPNQLLTVEGSVESQHLENNNSAYLTALTNSRYWKNPAAIASGQKVTTWMAANYPGQPAYDMYAPFGPAGDPYGRVTPVISSYFSSLDRAVDATYVARLTDKLVFNVVANYAWEDAEGINPLIGDPLADGTFAGVRVERFVNVRDSYNLNARFTYRFNWASTQHTLMVGDDNQWVVQRFPNVASVNVPSDPRAATTVTGLNMLSALYNYNPQTDRPANGTALIAAAAPFNSVRDNLQLFSGAYVADQAVLLDRSLFLVAGARYTTFRSHTWWPFRSDLERFVVPDATLGKWTPQYGALYKIGGGPVALYYTRSQSLVPQSQIDASGKTVQPVTSTGWDVGAKVDLLHNMLTGSIAYYSIYQTNTAIPDLAANRAHNLPDNGNPTFGYYIYGNAQQVRGLQADISYNVTRDFQLLLGYNHFLEFDYVAPNSNPLLVGLPIGNLPKTNAFVWGKYAFPAGPLKGLVLGGGVRYFAEERAGGGNFNLSQLYIPSYTVVDAMVGYHFNAFDRALKATLNVKNAGNKIYRDSGFSFGPSRMIELTIGTRF